MDRLPPIAAQPPPPAGWYPDPQSQRPQLRYWDGSRWTDWTNDYPPPVPAQPAERPQRLAGLSWLAIVPLALMIVCLLAWVIFSIRYESALADVRNGMPNFEEYQSAQDGFKAARGIYNVLGFAGLLFIPWFYRAYRNVERSGASGFRWSTGWAIGGWFVPFFVWWVCKVIANDIWRGRTLDDGLHDGSWRSRGVPMFVHVWWALWILSALLFGTGEVILAINSDPDLATATYDREQLGVAFDLAGILATVAAALLAIVFIRRVTEAEDRALGRGTAVATSPESTTPASVPTGTQAPVSTPPPATSSTPPAGWYPDPNRQAAHRYWDGSRWTDETSGPPPPA